MFEVTENLIVKRDHGWQAEIRVDMGEAQLLIVIASTGNLVKKTKSGTKQEYYSKSRREQWDWDEEVDMIMSMNGTAVFEPNEWAELMLMVRTARKNLGKKLYDEVKKK